MGKTFDPLKKKSEPEKFSRVSYYKNWGGWGLEGEKKDTEGEKFLTGNYPKD